MMVNSDERSVAMPTDKFPTADAPQADDDQQAVKQAQLLLLRELEEGRRSGEEEGWISAEDVHKHFAARAAK